MTLMDVAIQVFAYNEPGLETTLDAYAALEVPAFVDSIRYQACVTPARGAVARQVDVALEHDVFELVETPPGKLASRNLAHDRGADAGVDAIVVGDADAPPLSSSYLGLVLDPLIEPATVATNARPVAPWTPIGAATNAVAWLQDRAVPHINGQGHALSADGWRAAGPFDESAEAGRDVVAVRLEEEFAFRSRLAGAGDVVDVPAAEVYNDVRRTRCRLRPTFDELGVRSPAYCRRRGTETFQPRR